MQLTSEVDNILNGTVVKSTEDIKAIAVSDATINPDANGITPLSKQNALMKPLPDIQESQGVISDKPVDVASPEKLESFDFTNPLSASNEPTPVTPTESPVEEIPINISLPAQEEVMAQEPIGIDNSLFVNNNIGAEPEKETIETPTLETVTPALESAPLVSEPVAETPVLESTPELNSVRPVLETTPLISEEIAQAPTLESTPELSSVAPTLESTPVQAPTVEETPVEAVNQNLNETINNQEENINSDEIDKLFEEFKVNINNSIDEFKAKILEKYLNNTKVEVAINRSDDLESLNAVPTIEETPVSTLETMPTQETSVETPALEDLSAVTPGGLDQTPAVPSLDNAPTSQVDDIMADAMNQINNLSNPIPTANPEELPVVDDTQIKGMFI